MKFSALLLSVAFVSCGAVQKNDSKPQIVGGVLSANQTFYAGLVQKGSTFTFCGGTFVDAKTIVTAAHCAKAYGANIQVKVGYHNGTSGTHNILNVVSVTSHPSYNSRTMENDIAVVKLANYDPATLKTPIVPIPMNDSLTLANTGWVGDIVLYGTGATSESGAGAGNTFRTVTVNYIENSVCSANYASSGNKIFDSNLCAGMPTGGKDSCQGDSGGPAVVQTETGTVLVGVVSWGIGCARKDRPGVYARASSYIPWVSKYMEPVVVAAR